jgi:hypothetical protein
MRSPIIEARVEKMYGKRRRVVDVLSGGVGIA